MVKRKLGNREQAPEEIAAARIESALASGSRALDLSGLGLTSLPAALGALTELDELDISDNRLEDLPESISRLSRLRELDASQNLLTALPPFIGELKELTSLNAVANNITALPGEIGDLSKLEDLHLADNQLTALPDFIGGLLSLQTLDARKNHLTALPDSMGQLVELAILAIGDNKLQTLPAALGRLTGLQLLWVSNNRLTALPLALRNLVDLRSLRLDGNPALGLPPEIIGGPPDYDDSTVSPARVLDYYFSKSVSRPLNEAKMILVGRGAAGKTSLVNRLVRSRYNPNETKTDGIAITPWIVKVGNDDVRLNIWDFGGQEIMHATHQFFLTKRSLYVLVLNAREGEQDSNIEYWLRLIESFGGDSPVLVVINKVKEHPFDLNRRGLQAKFPAIRGFVQTDCDASIGLDDLQRAIVAETDRLEHLRDPFPASWFAVKDKLAEMPRTEGHNFIPFGRYQELCAENGVTESSSQETLVGFLHDLGIVVNFRDDPRLAETHVLNPQWVTNGIYKILNAETLARNQGELRLLDLPNVLDSQVFPKAMHLYLLDLMRKFELCYEFYESAGHYLVPELLGKEEPDLPEFAASDALRFEYGYNIVPEGLLPRFIVRSRALNKDLPRWRTGVVVEWDGNRGIVKADVQDKRVSVTVIGPVPGRRRLLAVIRADLEHIHRSIVNPQPIEQVPVPGNAGLVVRYKKLQAFEAKDITTFDELHGDDVITLNVLDLLNGIEEPTEKSRDALQLGSSKEAASVRVAFSYAHKDEELRDQLETHLKLLNRHGVISTWHDRKIMPGDSWAEVIDENFRRADVILLLVSADFVASDYCYEIEMRTALEREAKGEAKVVPVILRACDWHGAPFGRLQALPKDTKPVTSWPNRDEAWNDVARGIKRVAQEVRKRAR